MDQWKPSQRERLWGLDPSRHPMNQLTQTTAFFLLSLKAIPAFAYQTYD